MSHKFEGKVCIITGSFSGIKPAQNNAVTRWTEEQRQQCFIARSVLDR